MSTPYKKIAYFNNTPLYKLTDDEIENTPTPPPNEAGAPEGRERTIIFTGAVVILLRMVR